MHGISAGAAAHTPTVEESVGPTSALLATLTTRSTAVLLRRLKDIAARLLICFYSTAMGEEPMSNQC